VGEGESSFFYDIFVIINDIYVINRLPI